MVKSWQEFRDFVLRLFPERQLFLRSNNRVRYLTIPTPVQIVGSSALVVFFLWLCAATLQVILQSNSLQEREEVIKSINSDYLALSSDFTALEKELERRARLIEDRQVLIDKMVSDLVPQVDDIDDPDAAEKEDTPPTDAINPDGDDNIADSGSAIASMDHSARRQGLLNRMIALVDQQNAQAATLAHLLEDRTVHVEALMGRTSVNLSDIFALAQGPTGGPFVPDVEVPAVFDPSDDEPLRLMQQHYDAYTSAITALDNVPFGAPATKYYISDNFGPRIDPIKGTAARHPGIDIAAWKGTPVEAVAPGRIIFAGWNGPYGNMVDIDHGNGFKTRYGHMSELYVKKGDTVSRRHAIGAVGDTGRTTGVHIHYEVWFNGRLHDPMPFLKVEKDVLEAKGRYQPGETSYAD